MTDRKLMQQALEALDRVISHAQEAEDILLAALSEGTEQLQRTHWDGCEEVHPECKKPEQEPVAWRWKERVNNDFDSWVVTSSEPPPYAIEQQPLYTAPQRREWVGLTVAERKKINRLSVYVESAISLTEAKLKEKNNG